MAESSFWETSWQRIQPERIEEYRSDFDLGPDALVRQLHRCEARTVCDAGCGCGIYSLKLAANGFQVSGFDISLQAARLSEKLLESAGFSGTFRQASILSTGYPDDRFDGIVCRDVLDHMPRAQLLPAVAELLRITRPGGQLLITVDYLDEEYETEPHQVNRDGDYVFTDGKWTGMVFHPYTVAELTDLLPPCQISSSPDGISILIRKSV